MHIVYDVDPETVGQYTGLNDNTKWEQLTKEEQSNWLKNHTVEEWNGKKIWEGDILKAENFIGVVKYNEVIASFIVEINDTTTEYIHWSPLNEGDPSRQLQLQYTEKLGNIHYNPELLKGGVE